MSNRKFYITEIHVRVASPDRLVHRDGSHLSLSEIVEEITIGESSGLVEYVDERPVGEEEIAEELLEHGSDPNFLLGDDWDSERTEETLTVAIRNENKADY